MKKIRINNIINVCVVTDYNHKKIRGSKQFNSLLKTLKRWQEDLEEEEQEDDAEDTHKNAKEHVELEVTVFLEEA